MDEIVTLLENYWVCREQDRELYNRGIPMPWTGKIRRAAFSPGPCAGGAAAHSPRMPGSGRSCTRRMGSGSISCPAR